MHVVTLIATLAFAVAPADAVTFDRVTLSRTACFGTCPIYTVSVTRVGAIEYSGIRFVAQKGARRATLDADGLKRLQAAIDAADIDHLRDGYASQDDGCESLATDNPSQDLTIVLGGKEKRIHYYFGCDGPRVDADLARLAALGRAIDKILNSARWVGEPGASNE